MDHLQRRRSRSPRQSNANVQHTHFSLRTEIKAIGSIKNIMKLIGMELIARAATDEVGAAALDENDQTHDLSNAVFNGDGTITKADGELILATSVILRIVM